VAAVEGAEAGEPERAAGPDLGRARPDCMRCPEVVSRARKARQSNFAQLEELASSASEADFVCTTFLHGRATQVALLNSAMAPLAVELHALRPDEL
jgi:hypothetical protein